MLKKKIEILIILIIAFLDSLPLLAQDDSPYEQEFPVMNYGSDELKDTVSELQAKIDSGEVSLQFNPIRGYLDAALEALDISPASQLLVFSRTSLQQPLISPQTPRAIYFNEDVYVAWVQQSGLLEIASMDPNLGPVFFTLNQIESQKPQFNREFRTCLRCHDSLSLTGGGTPRFMMSSNYTGVAGQLVSHEGSIMTDSRTPISSRWGGWYVTGFHGDQRHLGNVLIQTAADISDENLARMGNRESLSALVEIESYITPYSDVVALLVVEHQIEVQNKIARTNFYARTLLDEKDQLEENEVVRGLEILGQELLHSLFMVGQPPLTDAIEGTSGFKEAFEEKGRKDAVGRSLWDLDMERRLFKYPLSYLIYSNAYAGLPTQIKEIVETRIEEILSDDNKEETYSHLSSDDKQAIRAIISATNWNS